MWIERHRRDLRRLIGALVIAISVAMASPALADDPSVSGAGTYGAAFLRVPAGARLMSVPSVVAGLTPDASLGFDAPALLVGLPNTQFLVSTTSWLEDIRFSALSVAVPMQSGTVLSLNSRFLYSGELQGYNDALQVVGETDYYDLGITAAAAHEFGSLSLGLGATWIRQHVLPADGNGYAFSLGAAYRSGATLLHASGANLAGNLRFDTFDYPVDANWTLGAARIFNAGSGRLTVGAQLRTSSAEADRIEFGADYFMGGFLSLRAGVVDIGSIQDSGFRGGFGVALGAMDVEYAYTPHEYLNGSHTISVLFGISGAGNEARAAVVEPAAQTAPIIAPSQILAQPASPGVTIPAPQDPAGTVSWAIVAGVHATLASARAEAEALELLGILTEVQPVSGATYRVIVARYPSRSDAEAAINRYQQRGHIFRVIAE